MIGSAVQTSGDAAGIKTENTIIIAGLGIQLGAFGVFTLNARMTVVSIKEKWKRYLVSCSDV